MTDTVLPAALRRRREYVGPALFSYGFRPFFLGASVWAALAVLLWLPQYFGEISVPTAFAPLDWHVHEMIFGYVAAAIAGFLLTAIPNWTGRLPVNGYPLAALVALWMAGRIAVATSAIIGAGIAGIIDVAFLLTLGAVTLREIISGSNWRNLRVIGVLAVLTAGNILFHVEAIMRGGADYSLRLAIAAVVCFIMIIGGRIVPSFTHSWLARRGPGRLPQKFSRYDVVALATSIVALACWIAAPHWIWSGIVVVIAGLVQAIRVARWAGDRTFGDRLVLVLHVAYWFIPIGFVLLGLSIIWPADWPASAGLHAWMAGAAGLMTLAVMTRASLGHTGNRLVASIPTQLIYLCVFVAALSRIVAAFEPSIALYHIAAMAWVLAFAGFAAVFGPKLFRRLPAD
ncbi:MAG: NnrS family protein [Xanthobacteraceae bacterium]